MKNMTLMLAAALLCACAPKYNYTRADLDQKPLPSEVVVIVDYFAVVDDVGELWDYKQEFNDKRINRFRELVSDLLGSSGYLVADKGIISSGLGLSSHIEFDYYIDGKKQDQPRSAPFKLEVNGFNDSEVQATVELSDELIRVAGSTPVKEETLHQLAQADFSRLLDRLSIPKETLVLVIRLNEPSVSFTKSFGLALVSAAATGAATGGSHISYVSLSGQPSAFAFLIDRTSGKLIWKNYSPYVDRRDIGSNILFKEFPGRDMVSE